MSQIELQHAFGRIDRLSGLPNRTQFEEDLEDLARDRPEGDRYLAAFIELATSDELSQAIRVLGVSFMDDIVREAATSLRVALGPDRKAYHVGVNQFVFLSPPGVEETAYVDMIGCRLAEIRSAAASRFITTTVVGLAPFEIGTMEPRDVLRTGLSAVQDARASGKAISVYSAAHDEAHRRRFALLGDFGSALVAEEQLRLVFQPRVDLASSRCVGAEALLRWRHPSFGEVSPAEFIPIIEQTSMARATTTWVLKRAMAQLAEWRSRDIDLRISVNVAVSNLREPDFAARVGDGLATLSLPPSSFELEITESAVMDDAGLAINQLEAIAATGVHLAIDDFGTGYSSLSYLQRLPTRTLKIDRSFVDGCETDPRKNSLIAAMVSLAHDLEYRVVAEGVETQACLDHLAALACDEVQGYVFGRPMEPVAFTEWLANFHGKGSSSLAA